MAGQENRARLLRLPRRDPRPHALKPPLAFRRPAVAWLTAAALGGLAVLTLVVALVDSWLGSLPQADVRLTLLLAAGPWVGATLLWFRHGRPRARWTAIAAGMAIATVLQSAFLIGAELMLGPVMLEPRQLGRWLLMPVVLAGLMSPGTLPAAWLLQQLALVRRP